VNVEHEVVVLVGDLQCGLLCDTRKILKVAFCITVFYLYSNMVGLKTCMMYPTIT